MMIPMQVNNESNRKTRRNLKAYFHLGYPIFSQFIASGSTSHGSKTMLFNLSLSYDCSSTSDLTHIGLLRNLSIAVSLQEYLLKMIKAIYGVNFSSLNFYVLILLYSASSSKNFFIIFFTFSLFPYWPDYASESSSSNRNSLESQARCL